MSLTYRALHQAGALESGDTDYPPAHALAEQFGAEAWDFDLLTRIEPRSSSKQAILNAAHGFIAEQFRLLQTRLGQIRQTRPLKTVLVTSSLAEEGKTFVALNLAVSLAQRGARKVLLLDCDLRRPAQCRRLGIAERPGLSDWLKAQQQLSKFACRIDVAEICLLPAGGGIEQPLELLSSERMRHLLDEVSSVFEWVIIDSAPLLPYADSGVLSRLCDGTLVVVRREKGMKSALPQALERVEHTKLVGLVLNDFQEAHQYAYQGGHKSRTERPRASNSPQSNANMANA